MAEYKPLTDKQVEEIAEKYYGKNKDKSEGQSRPVIVLVGAQPGAGKSLATRGIRQELLAKGGYIHIDADRMREKIDTNESKPTSAETQPDAGKLVTRLRELAIDGKRNIIEEGTFRNQEQVGKFIDTMHEKGYKVEMLAVATSKEESTVGIYQRYESQHIDKISNPRFVDQAYHDTAMEGFDKTLVSTATKLDRLRVTDRSGTMLYDSNAQSKMHASALQAVKAGRELTDQKLSNVRAGWAEVEANAKGRGASATYLADLSKKIEHIESMKKERIAMPRRWRA